MIGITVAIASATYYLVSGMTSKETTTAPNIIFTEKDGNLIVTSCQGDYVWEDFSASSSGNASNVTLPSGTVKAGDVVTMGNEVPDVMISFQDRVLIGEWDF